MQFVVTAYKWKELAPTQSLEDVIRDMECQVSHYEQMRSGYLAAACTANVEVKVRQLELAAVYEQAAEDTQRHLRRLKQVGGIA